MLGIKAKIVNSRHRLGLTSSNASYVSTRIIKRCIRGIRGGSALLHRANYRLYSTRPGGSIPPDSFGGPDVPFHRESYIWCWLQGITSSIIALRVE